MRFLGRRKMADLGNETVTVTFMHGDEEIEGQFVYDSASYEYWTYGSNPYRIGYNPTARRYVVMEGTGDSDNRTAPTHLS